ncbi:PE-PPE domain-containing protein [Corynebacterium kozikiae]|uniref:PE-PPE domain-containing protein n=1 Tax=Corynebacterium kozikiae TaxID=2968469 RepID=UPI00211C26DF|nr:PE-PPE domain-containing protein [Corynebacterium sp. 76QC2CO]MCQ9342864.1 PE-PPE domain-containing protein [Corynebacterium sp. 76QC2CO]
MGTHKPQIRPLIRRLAAIGLAAVSCAGAVLASGSGAQAAQAVQATQTQASQPRECAPLVVVASRGSNQNKPEQLGTDNLSPNLRGFLNSLNAALAAHPDADARALAPLPVIALPPSEYPAEIPFPEYLEHVSLSGSSEARVDLREKGPRGVVREVVQGFNTSMDMGITHTKAAIEAFERDTGCTPNYLLAGYSQGILVNNAVEPWLYERVTARGNTVTAMTLVDPFQPVSGILAETATLPNLHGYLPIPLYLPDQRVSHLRLCFAGDYVCQLGFSGLLLVDLGRINIHAHYFDPQREAANITAGSTAENLMLFPKHRAQEAEFISQATQVVLRTVRAGKTG